MTEFSASVAGGRDMLLFCDKVVKDDIQVWIKHAAMMCEMGELI